MAGGADRFFDLSPDFFVVSDPEGRILTANPALHAALGYAPGSLSGVAARELQHPEDIDPAIGARARAVAGQPIIDHLSRWRTRGGAYLHISWRTSGAEDGRIYAVGRDVTERQRMLRVLHETQSLARVGGFELDLESGERHWTEETYRILGCAAVPPGPSTSELMQRVSERARAATTAAVESAISKGEPFEVQVPFEAFDGTLRWLHAVGRAASKEGRVIRVWGAVQDITERHQSEEALRESETRYRSLYRRTPAMLHSIDHDGRLLSVSDRWLETLGYTRAEVIGRRSTEFLTEDSRRYAREVVLPAFMADGFCQDVEYQYVTKDGRIIDTLLSATSERDAAGEVERSLAVITDVTAKKRADRALRASLAEKEALLKEVHHRVKNNLQVVSSLLRLQAGRAGVGAVHDTLVDAEQRVRAMALIHERLYRSDDLARIDFQAYLSELVGELRLAMLRAGVAIELDAEGAELELETAIPCGLIVSELVSNALKHAFPDDRPGRIVVRVSAGQGEVRLVVSDDGVGLPEPLPARGTLGLTLVERLAAQLGAQLAVERGPGTTFSLRFPPAREDLA